jgi:two-component system, chemotaxis family, chemotaxis protein CheY
MKVLIVKAPVPSPRLQAKSLKAGSAVEVVEAVGGEDCLKRLEASEGVDVILTDLNMPGVDGLEVIRAVTSHEKFGQIPIIVITGECEKKKVIEAMRAGARNFLVEPYTPETLRAKIDEVVSPSGDGAAR